MPLIRSLELFVVIYWLIFCPSEANLKTEEIETDSKQKLSSDLEINPSNPVPISTLKIHEFSPFLKDEGETPQIQVLNRIKRKSKSSGSSSKSHSSKSHSSGRSHSHSHSSRGHGHGHGHSHGRSSGHHHGHRSSHGFSRGISHIHGHGHIGQAHNFGSFHGQRHNSGHGHFNRHEMVDTTITTAAEVLFGFRS